MNLKARVGRHTKLAGRQCQNWASDQETVVRLLNRIPAAHGGAGGGLHPGIVDGIASDELYRAIQRLEDLHVPRQGSGFIDPGGALWGILERLAVEQPAPDPPEAPAKGAPKPPTNVERQIEEATRSLNGNPHQAAVLRLLRQLKVDGYSEVIQNSRFGAYVFGTAQIMAYRSLPLHPGEALRGRGTERTQLRHARAALDARQAASPPAAATMAIR